MQRLLVRHAAGGQLARFTRPSAVGSTQCVPLLSQQSTAVASSQRAFCGAAVSAAMVKALRDRTGASMGKCRAALVEEGGDVEKAVEWLRKRGVKSMEKRSAEVGEALLALSMSGSAGAIVELRAETDFVTRGALFQQLNISLANTVAASGRNDNEGVLATPLQLPAGAEQAQLQEKKGMDVSVALLELGSVVGERLVLGNAWLLQAAEGCALAGYVHPKSAGDLTGTGRMAALVAVKGSPTTEAEKLNIVANKLARHIVASQPKFLSVDSVPQEVVDKEMTSIKEAHLAQMDPSKAANLDEKLLDKVVEGKLKKFYTENVLLNQEFIAAQEESAKPPSVQQWLQKEAKALGADSLVVEDFRVACLA
eukprot:TRINITY_DN31582_c0_g1_i1.p1 TRINITY_DN31582_c0_g1~~TRINITY_DN31582_c0_g1_i1.p1  ORF type:complete len:367 (-),score=103.16 TRINITY_DN31582_c0_g1_i1:188-1288(-)